MNQLKLTYLLSLLYFSFFVSITKHNIGPNVPNEDFTS